VKSKLAHVTLWLLVVATTLAPGCAGDGAAPAAVDGAAAEIPSGPAADLELGGFVVDLVAGEGGEAGYTSVSGKVYDGALPSPVIWTAVADSGGCRLLTPRVPFCSPGCGGVAICAADGQCVPYPSARDVGTVRVSGLGASSFEMTALLGSYQPAATVSLPMPPSAEGEQVVFRAAGASLPAFTVESRGVAPLSLAGSFALAADRALVFTWPAPADPGQSEIEVKLDISHHGGTKGKIECQVADSGTLSIPADQITRLLALGAAGFPTIEVTRVARGIAALAAGRISLRVTSTVEVPVEVPGVRSCTEDSDCPSGGSCQDDLSCK
jgi:hypothetical protein